MAADKTETHEIDRRGEVVTLKVTYTPRQGRPVRMYRLLMEVVSVTGDISPKVFVYQRSTAGAPAEGVPPVDEFVCVADELDENEIPEDEPNMAKHVPYYRIKTVELLFRNSDLMYETAREIISSIASR